MDKLFKSGKPVIGMVHLAPLIGSYRYGGDDEAIRTKAVNDALSFERAGMDGIIVENYGDAPYYAQKVKLHTVAQMTTIISGIKKELSIPVGVNVLRNDTFAALAMARVAGCEFVRVNVLTGVVATDQGLVQSNAAEIMNYKKEIGCEAKVFADVHVKHATQIHLQDIRTAAYEAVHRAGADAVIVSGKATGDEIDLAELKQLKKTADFPVFAGSGITRENIDRYYPYCDGMIIGSYFKNEKDPQATVDYQKARLLFEKIEEIKKKRK